MMLIGQINVDDKVRINEVTFQKVLKWQSGQNKRRNDKISSYFGKEGVNGFKNPFIWFDFKIE